MFVNRLGRSFWFLDLEFDKEVISDGMRVLSLAYVVMLTLFLKDPLCCFSNQNNL